MPEVAKSLLVILPVVIAGVAHSVAIRRNYLSWAAKRLDFGVQLFGEPLFGENKTFRGPLIMAAVSSVGALALSFVFGWEQFPRGLGRFLAQPGPALLFGLLMGVGYSLGELPNSFAKRRLGL